MRKNLFCPNLSLPENKALVEKLGLNGFYKEYIKNNYSIPTKVYEDLYDGTISVEDIVYVNKDLFNGYQQEEIINSILYEVQNLRNGGETNVGIIKNEIKTMYSETAEYFNDSTDEDYNPELAKILNDIVDNFDSFFDRVNKKLAAQDIFIETVDNDLSNDQESSYDSSENLNQKLNYSDESNFTQSTKDTASAQLKVTLSTIPKYVYRNGEVVLDEDGNPEMERSFIGSPLLESMDSIWNNLLYTLVDVPIGRKLEYLRTSNNPKHRIIANHILSSPDISVVNQFESVFSKQQAKFVTVLYSRPDKAGVKSIRVIDTNRMNADNIIADAWYQSFLNSSLVSDNNGNKIINTTRGKELLKEYEDVSKLIKSDSKAGNKAAKVLLNKIGIDISTKALESEGIMDNGSMISPAGIITNKLKYVFESLAGNKPIESTEDLLEVNNPYIDENSTIELLAKLENKVNPVVFEASFVSGDGKSKYSFVNNSFVSHQVRKLKNDEAYRNKLKETAYASGSFLLDKLINDPNFRDIFEIEYVDSLGNDSNNQTNKTFASMNTKEKELTRVSYFQNAGRGTTNAESNIGRFIGLINSDKTTTTLFKTLKVGVKIGNNLDADGNIIFNRETYKVMYNQFMSEYNRVKQTFTQLDDDSINKIHEYHTGAQLGRRFVVFPFMNNILIQNNQLLELDDIRLETLVRPALTKFMSDLTKSQVNYWKELDIFPNSENFSNFFDKSYASKNGISLNERVSEQDWSKYGTAFAANYAVNQFIFFMNQTQLISGDPALHGKSVIRDGDVQEGKSIDKTWINFYKRMAKDIAPGTDGNFGENATYNTILLKDFKLTSAQYMEYLEKVGDVAKAYGYDKDGNGAINPADAQEYTTLDEHLTVMRAYGRLSAQQEEAAQRLKDGGEDINDIQLILQPMKPVYVNSQIEDGINTMYYIKSSSFPLIPALTKGLEIDKLRRFMEDPKNNIQRAAYESAAKLGIQGQLANLSDNGGIEFKDLTPDDVTVINLSRSGFRLQQEMPYHGDHPSINECSQGRKLVLNNLSNTDVIKYNGKDYTGREVKNIFEKLHIEKMNRSLNQLIVDLGFNLETGQLEDISKIQQIIKEEAESRDYPVNDLYSIQLIEENGVKKFKVPISFSNNATRFESILNSVFTNRVIKSELPGFMGIQGASSGFQNIMSDVDFNNSVASSGIVWLDPKDTQLNYIREDESGNILSADILVPNYFRNSEGNQINLRDYIKEDGTLDTNRIPEDVLTIIGLRIPTQGYNSMMKFRVKGFLPNIVGDLVVVPAEVTIQMGSDFDVDKLFIYRYHYKMSKDGSIIKVKTDLPESATDIDYSNLSKEQIDNLIIQTFEDRLSDKRLMDEILTPNGFGKLPEVASEIAKLDKSVKPVHTFSTKDQNSISDVNVAGKMGTAQFSLFSTFFKAAQDAGLKLNDDYSFVIKNSKNEIVELNSLSNIINSEGDKTSNVIMYLQSAAVDNAKEQILGKLNINDYTMGVAGTMAMMGMDEEFIGYFLSQPSLKELISRVSTSNNIIDGGLDFDIMSKTLSNLIIELNNEPLTVEQKNILNKVPFGTNELKQALETTNNPLDLTQLSNEELNLINRANNIFQLQILNKFQTLLELAGTIQSLQSATNLDTKGLGATYGAVKAKSMQINNILNKGVNSPTYPVWPAANLFYDNTVAKANQVLETANYMLGQIYTYNSITYDTLIREILDESSQNPTENNLRDIYTNLKSFILSNPDLLNLENIDLVRDSLLYGKDNIAKRWLDYSSSAEGKRNPLTKRITARIAKNDEDYNGLKAVNTPASNNSLDINTSIMYFYDMINSDNSTERRLAEDMVKYHIITGATYGPQSIGKYITYDILEKYDFSRKLRDIDAMLRNSEVFNSFISQYFRNNPFKSSTFDIDVIGGKVGDTVVVPINNNPFRNGNNEALRFFNVYDKAKSTPVLYMLNNVSPSHLEYSKVSILGNKLIKKYNYLATDNNAVVSRERESLPERSLSQSQTNSNSSIVTKTDYFENRYGSNNSISETLDNIINKSNNPYFVKVAKDLLNSNRLDNVNLEYSNSRVANGWYTNNTVYLNADLISASAKTNNQDELAKFEEVFLHELLHAGTVSAIDNFDNLNDNQKKAVKKIQRLYSEYISNYPNKEELDRYTMINELRLQGDSISEEDLNFLIENKSKLYHLTNIKEFIAAGLTNPDVKSDLQSKNLWTKFLDFISELFGIDKSDLDFLYQSTIELVNNNTSTDTINIYAGANENADLSNFAIRSFTIGADEFQSVEQYFQYQKWNYLNDNINKEDFEYNSDIADKIMNTNNGALLKSLGRKFKNLDSKSWDNNASKEMKIAIKESFKQNPESLKILLSTGNSTLTHVQDKGKWGKEFPRILMEVRSELRNNISEDLFASNDEYNRLEFIKQRDEFLRAHKTAIGKKITDATLTKFQKSQQDKSKYDRLKISSWNGELRISRVDPVFEDISESKIEKESAKDKSFRELLNRLKINLKRLQAKLKEEGDNASPDLELKISKLEDKIKTLEAEKNINAFIEISEDRLSDIDKNIESYDIYDVETALGYTKYLRNLNKELQFTEEYNTYNDIVDSISARASRLTTKLNRLAGVLIDNNNEVQLETIYNVNTVNEAGVKEVGKFESSLLDATESSSNYVQNIQAIIDRSKFDTNEAHTKFIEEFTPILNEYKAKYGNKYDRLLQKNANGKNTGSLLNKYSQKFYDTTKGDKAAYVRETDIEITEEGLKLYESHKKHIYDNYSPQDFLLWESENNPEIFVEQWRLGKVPSKWGARKYTKILPKEKWLDPNYTQLKSLPEADPLVKFYNFIEPIIRRNNKKYNTQLNYIPEIALGDMDLIYQGKFKQALNGLNKGLKDAITGEEYVISDNVDFLTNESKRSIPVRFFGAELTPDLKSYDLAAVVEQVVYQEEAIKYKQSVEPYLNTYYSLLKDSRQIVKYDDSGNPITIEKEASNLINQSRYIIQEYLYDKNRAENQTEGWLGKATDKLISLTRLLGMGWNPASGLGNVMQGMTSNFIYASDKKFFTKKEFSQSTLLALNSIAGSTTNAKKISKLFKKFDTFVKSNELNYGMSRELNSINRNRIREYIEPFALQQGGEYFVQGQTMIGILLHDKVELADGTKVSLWDGYDDNGNWKSEYGEDPFKDKTKLYKMTMKIRKAISDVHGNYSRPIQIKKDFYGRALMTFRTWLPQAIHTRFSPQRTNKLLGITTKGRYLSFASMFKNSDGKLDFDVLAQNSKWLIGLSKNSNLSEIDKNNMRKNLSELALIGVFLMISMLAKAYIDDLDEDERMIVTYFINSMDRTYNDLTFFINPSSFDTIIKDPIPLMRTIKQYGDIAPAMINFIMDEDIYKTGVRKDRSKLGKELADVSPLFNNIDKTILYSNEVLDEYYSR